MAEGWDSSHVTWLDWSHRFEDLRLPWLTLIKRLTWLWLGIRDRYRLWSIENTRLQTAKVVSNEDCLIEWGWVAIQKSLLRNKKMRHTSIPQWITGDTKFIHSRSWWEYSSLKVFSLLWSWTPNWLHPDQREGQSYSILQRHTVCSGLWAWVLLPPLSMTSEEVLSNINKFLG